MSAPAIDIEKRIELAAVEVFNALLSEYGETAPVVRARAGSSPAVFPCIALEAYNLYEDPPHSGNHRGGLRAAGITYIDDDKNRDEAVRLRGIARSIFYDSRFRAMLNDSASSKAAASRCWFIGVETDANPAYFGEPSLTDRTHRANIEVTIVVAATRPQ